MPTQPNGARTAVASVYSVADSLASLSTLLATLLLAMWAVAPTSAWLHLAPCSPRSAQLVRPGIRSPLGATQPQVSSSSSSSSSNHINMATIKLGQQLMAKMMVVALRSKRTLLLDGGADAEAAKSAIPGAVWAYASQM